MRIDDLGQGEHHAGCVIMPGFVNAHSHLEYAVYAGFGDGLPFVPWIGMHIQRKDALDFDDMTAIATVGAHESPALGRHDRRRLQLLGRHRPRRRLERAPRDRLPRGLRHRRLGARPLRRERTPGSSTLSRTASGSASPRTRRTRARSRSTAPAPSSGFRRQRTSPRARPSATGSSTAPATGARSRDSSCRRRVRRGSGCSPPKGLLGPSLMAAHCVHADAEEIELLARHGVGVAHCPRSNGYLGCGVAPLAELREAGVAVSIATDSPASTPSLDIFDEIRAAIVGARARAGDPGALTAADALELATLGGARVLGLSDRIGSLVPGKQADLAVISLVDSPFDPVEDPVIAVVLGGSPDRVAATLVAGEQRYVKGTSRWPDSTRAARRARSKMLP